MNNGQANIGHCAGWNANPDLPRLRSAASVVEGSGLKPRSDGFHLPRAVWTVLRSAANRARGSDQAGQSSHQQ